MEENTPKTDQDLDQDKVPEPAPNPENPAEKTSKGLLIALIVILAVLVIGGGIWLFTLYSKIADIETDLADKDEPKIEKEIEEPKEEPKEEEEDEEVIEDEEEEEEEEEPVRPTEIDYYNRKYGFGLTFPSTWEDYVVSERDTNWGDFTAKSLYFGFPVQKDGLFAISVFTPQQWKDLQDLPEGRQVTFLGKNSQYTFAWSHAQYLANEEMEKRAQEIGDIIDSFYTDAK